MGPGVRNYQCDVGRHGVEHQETDEGIPSYPDADTLRKPILSAMCADNTFIKERLVKNYISELLLIEIYLHLLVKGITRCNEYRVILLIEGFRSN